MSDTMRAAVFSEFGGPEVVEVREDVPVREPGPGEVRLRVEAAAMNHLDLWIRRGLPIETPMPHIGGSDIAGAVEALGAGVEGVPPAPPPPPPQAVNASRASTVKPGIDQ